MHIFFAIDSIYFASIIIEFSSLKYLTPSNSNLVIDFLF